MCACTDSSVAVATGRQCRHTGKGESAAGRQAGNSRHGRCSLAVCGTAGMQKVKASEAVQRWQVTVLRAVREKYMHQCNRHGSRHGKCRQWRACQCGNTAAAGCMKVQKQVKYRAMQYRRKGESKRQAGRQAACMQQAAKCMLRRSGSSVKAARAGSAAGFQRPDRIKGKVKSSAASSSGLLR